MGHRLHAAADADLDVARADRLSISPAERMPDAQTLLIVSEETSFGIPPLICAWREGICPWPACSTWPMMTCSPARARRRPARAPPRSRCRRARWHRGRTGRRRACRRACGRRRGSRSRAWRCELVRCPRAFSGASSRPTRHTRPRQTPTRVVVGVFEGEDVAHDAAGGELQALLDERRGAPRLPQAGGHPRRRASAGSLVGLGKRDEFDAERARVAAAVAYGRAGELGARTLCWEVPHHVGDDVVGRAWSRARCSPHYRFDRFKSGPRTRTAASAPCSSPPTTTSPAP